jgi:CRP-like cAMP-binding protein
VSARRLSALRSVPGLARLATDEVAALAAVAEERFIARGALLVRRGDAASRAFVLLDGRARTGPTLLGAHAIVGGLEMLAGVHAEADVVAETDVLALVLRRADVLDFFEESFAATHAAMRALAGEILAAVQRIDGGHHPLRRVPAPPPRPPAGPLTLADKLLQLHTGLVMGQSRLEAVAALAQSAVEERWRRGAVLWRAGDRAGAGFSIVAGAVECRRPGRAPYVVARPLDVGVVEAYAGASRWYEAVAAADTIALRLDIADVIDVIEDHTDLIHDVLKGLAATLLQLGRPQ